GDRAEAALARTLETYVAAFQGLSNPFFRERIYDIKDVFRRILWHLRPRPVAGDAAGGRLVLVAREASVLDLFSVDLDRLAAVVVERGGPQSHAAILARSLGVPMVGQVPGLLERIHPGRLLRVDGASGRIDLDPPAVDVVAADREAAHAAPTAGRSHDDGGVRPGLPRVQANINLLYEVERAIAQGVDGVGLYRTEFLFLARRTLPTEEEQVGIYRKLLATLGGRPVSIRTFDLRPDKLAHGAPAAQAATHPLDWRLVLDSPPLRRLFKDQVRAILRAAAAGPARILVPLVARTELLDFVVETIDTARDELRREGLEAGVAVPLGVMIEVAAAAVMAGTWAESVDFFTLGTNDLLASALGVDRDDPIGSDKNDLLHPGLLRLIQGVAVAARRCGRPVTVCGEMAADPLGALALTALEVDSLSVAVDQLGPTRRRLADEASEVLTDLAPELVGARTAAEVRGLLQRRSALQRSG
ncbi:MAG TPA: putative PEP-binding protein, partial [Isosphaeraceae bacterium]